MITKRGAQLVCAAYYLASFAYIYVMDTYALTLNRIVWTDLKLHDQVMIIAPVLSLQVCGLTALWAYHVEAKYRQCSRYIGTKFSGLQYPL